MDPQPLRASAEEQALFVNYQFIVDDTVESESANAQLGAEQEDLDNIVSRTLVLLPPKLLQQDTTQRDSSLVNNERSNGVAHQLQVDISISRTLVEGEEHHTTKATNQPAFVHDGKMKERSLLSPEEAFATKMEAARDSDTDVRLEDYVFLAQKPSYLAQPFDKEQAGLELSSPISSPSWGDTAVARHRVAHLSVDSVPLRKKDNGHPIGPLEERCPGDVSHEQRQQRQRQQQEEETIAVRKVMCETYELFQSAFDEAVGVILKSGYKSIYDIQLDGDMPCRAKAVPDSFLLVYRDGGLIIPLDDLDPYSPTYAMAESIYRFRARFAYVLEQMMYVSGETAEPSVETTSIIEDIVRQQVIELLRQCTDLASRRGSRSININDLIFQIRHDTAKVSRLRTFLSWKDVRKNVKDSDDKGGDADLGAGEDPSGGVVAGGPVDDSTKKNKKAKVGLPWEPSSFFSQEVPERDDEEDEEEEEMNFITLQRLRKADERTKAMTREEYVTWSEYRQASFTYRKGKRFREWAGFGIVTDSKPSDDIVDILGFLTFEMVQTLTENALKVKEQEEAHKAINGGGTGDGEGASKKRKLQQGLFDPPSEGKTPIEPRHVQEAFRRLQARGKKSRAMLIGTRLSQHTPLTIF